MLAPAILHESELQKKILLTTDDPSFMYFHLNDSYEPLDIKASNWNKLSYVSINDDGDITGFIGCQLHRQARYAYSMTAISFENSNVFSLDLVRFFDLIFLQRNINKLNFSVVIGNPAEKMYDKFVERYGGRIVGIYEDDTILLDGKLYDLKVYEIKRDSYVKYRK